MCPTDTSGVDGSANKSETSRKKSRRASKCGGETSTNAGTRQSKNFYSDAFGDDELDALARAEASASLEDEIALLKLIIRRSLVPNQVQSASEEDLTSASFERVRKYIETLCRAFRVQHSLKGGAAKDFDEVVVKTLEEVGAELGIDLTKGSEQK